MEPIYTGGATVPLSSTGPGAYGPTGAFGTVTAVPPGGLTPAQIAGKSLSGAGIAGAAAGGVATSIGFAQSGAGFAESLGAGAGAAVGSLAGQTAGAIAGASFGGGSQLNPGSAALGGAIGGFAGGVAGGTAGSLGGAAAGRAIDNFFNPPTPVPGGAFGSGPETDPGTPGQSYPPGSSAVGYTVCSSGTLYANGVPFRTDPPSCFPMQGPLSTTESISFAFGIYSKTLTITGANGGLAVVILEDDYSSGEPRIRNGRVTFERSDGLPEPEAVPAIPPTRAPNPSRNPGGTPIPFLPGDLPIAPLAPPSFPNGIPTGPSPLAPEDEEAAPPWPFQPPDKEPARVPFQPPAPYSPNPDFNPQGDPNPGPTPNLYPPIGSAGGGISGGSGGGSGSASSSSGRQTEEPQRIPVYIPPAISPPSGPPMGFVNPPNINIPTIPIQIPSGGSQPVDTPSNLKLPNKDPDPQTNPKPVVLPTPVGQAPKDPDCCNNGAADLAAIKRAIGVDGLPASVPDQIAKTNPAQIQVASLAELHLWQVQQLDGVLGRWPQQIPIPTPTGTVNVGMPNVSETMAEMIGMLVSQQVTAAQILNTSSRTLVQAGSATQQALLAQLTAKANAEFLGYETKQKDFDIPLTYSPGLDLFEGLLNPSNQLIKGTENTDKTDIKSIFAELLHAAAIIRAVYWRKLDPKADFKRQVQDNLRAQSNFIDDEAGRATGGGDWEEYLRQVEQGFSQSTGDQSPYNRNPDEGPKIRDVGPNSKE